MKLRLKADEWVAIDAVVRGDGEDRRGGGRLPDRRVDIAVREHAERAPGPVHRPGEASGEVVVMALAPSEAGIHQKDHNSPSLLALPPLHADTARIRVRARADD
jgi:hypothetical protein